MWFAKKSESHDVLVNQVKGVCTQYVLNGYKNQVEIPVDCSDWSKQGFTRCSQREAIRIMRENGVPTV